MNARRVIVAAGLMMGLVGSAFGGDLHPPAGPIEGTMVTLDQVEPRWVVDTVPPSTDAVHHITQPGNYVLTGDISVPSGKSGIVIDLPPGVSGGVTIDFNGFHVVGQPGSLHAVHCKGGGGGGAGGSRTYNLMSTFPTQWRSMGGSGLVVDAAGSVTVSGVTVSQCGGDGLYISNAMNATVSASVDDCDDDGVEFAFVPTVQYVAIKERGTGAEKNGIARCDDNGVVVTQCGSVTISGLSVSQCGQDGLQFVDTQDIALSSVSVEDGGGDGVEVVRARRVRACCIGSSGEDGVELSVARVGGYGILVVGGCDDVKLQGFVVGTGLHGVRVEDAARCEISCSVVDTGGSGMQIVRCPDLTCGMAINVKGTGADKNRVANTGGNGIELLDCGQVEVGGMTASSCQGDGLHVSGAVSVSVTDWRDNDCDDDGIEISAGAGSPPVVHVRDSFSNRAGGNGATIECKMGRVELARFIGATGHGLDIDGDSLELSECTANENGQRGVSARGRKDMLQWYCVANDNGWEGIMLLPVLGSVQEKAKQVKCSVRGNGFSLPGGGSGIVFDGIASVVMQECDSSGNAGSGVVIADLDRDGRLDLVTCSSNGLHGVHVVGSTLGLPGGRLTATGVFSDGNGLDGMRLDGTTGGQLSECVSSNNGGMGMQVFGSSHVVRSNSCTSNGLGAMFVLPGNVVGPLVDELTVAGNCNPAANYVH